MAGKVLTMRAMAAVLAYAVGQPMNVTQVCRECGISTKTFYKYVERCRVDLQDGFTPRSRRPLRSPGATSVDVEDAIVALRKQLANEGHDHGATTIQSHLVRDRPFDVAVPSVATIHRILVRRGFVTPQPHKRPKSSWCRFEAPAPNECWQIDSTEWAIQDGLAKIFNIVDDHSRIACRSRAVSQATAVEAWTTFCQAAQRWGLPAGVLSDNGLCFSGRLHGHEVLFEANLRDAGIRPMTGRGHHPQTTGKVERFQQTLKRWLRRQDQVRGLARNLADLQHRLDQFCTYYNDQRPHQGIGRTTPLARWTASPAARPAASPLEHPVAQCRPHTLVVNDDGEIKMGSLAIGIGVEWSGCTVTVIIDPTDHATVLCENQLVRHLRIDRTRSYQPTGRPRGGPKRPRRLPS